MLQSAIGYLQDAGLTVKMGNTQDRLLIAVIGAMLVTGDIPHLALMAEDLRADDLRADDLRKVEANQNSQE